MIMKKSHWETVNVLKAFDFIHGLLIITIILSNMSLSWKRYWGGRWGRDMLVYTRPMFRKLKQTNMFPPLPVVLFIHLGCFGVSCHFLRMPSVEMSAFSPLSWHFDGAHPLTLSISRDGYSRSSKHAHGPEASLVSQRGCLGLMFTSWPVTATSLSFDVCFLRHCDVV